MGVHGKRPNNLAGAFFVLPRQFQDQVCPYGHVTMYVFSKRYTINCLHNCFIAQHQINRPRLLDNSPSWYRGTSHVVCLLIITRKVSVSRRITAYSLPDNIRYQLYNYIDSSHFSRPPNSHLKHTIILILNNLATITTANTIVRHHPAFLHFGNLDS